MNKYCNETGVAIVPWGTLAEGQLARPLSARGTTTRSAAGDEKPSNLRPAGEEIVHRVEALAKKKGWTMSQVTLAWTMKRVTSPIIGFSTVERIDEALSAHGKELTPEEEKYLEDPYTPTVVESHD